MYNKWIDFDFYQYHKSSASKRAFAFAQGKDAYAECVNQGISKAENGEWVKAKEFWLRGVGLEPLRAEARADLGLYYEQAKEYANAVEAYTDAAIIAGEPWQEYCRELVPKIIKNHEAKKELEQQLAQSRARRQLAGVEGRDKFSQLVMEGMRSFNQGRYPDALLDWQKAMELRPKHTELLGNIGMAYEFEGNFTEAEKYYLQAARQYGKPWRDYYRDILLLIGLKTSSENNE